jgi:hypothetical protein
MHAIGPHSGSLALPDAPGDRILRAQEAVPMSGKRMAAGSTLVLLVVTFRRAIARRFIAVTGTTVRSERP